MNIKSDKAIRLTIEEKDSITVILFDKGNLEAVYESELEADNSDLLKSYELKSSMLAKCETREIALQKQVEGLREALAQLGHALEDE